MVFEGDPTPFIIGGIAFTTAAAAGLAIKLESMRHPRNPQPPKGRRSGDTQEFTPKPPSSSGNSRPTRDLRRN